MENNTCIHFLSIVCYNLQGNDIPQNTETKRFLSVLGQEINGWMGAKKTKNGVCRSMRNSPGYQSSEATTEAGTFGVNHRSWDWEQR